MSKKPTEKFSFGGEFSVGGGQAGEDKNAVVAGGKAAWKPRGKAAPVEESEEEEEEEDEEEGEDNDFANLPKEVLRRITAIRNIHTDYEEVDAAYKQERIALETKYLARKMEVIEKRRQIVSGEVDVPADAEEADAEKDSDAPEVKGIPGFWLTCLTSHPATSELVTEEDIQAMEAITDITCAYDETFTSFTVTFHFRDNEFFTNKTLSKKYEVSPDLLDDKAPALSECSGTDIDWKAGKNLTVTETVKKQKAKSGKNKGQVKTVVTSAPKPSFFHYFGMPMTEEEEADFEEQEQENEEAVRVKLSMEEDYDIGHSIRTCIIPEAVLWYTGEAMEDDGDDDEDGEYDEEEDPEGLFEDADDNDEDDEEEEEEEPRMKAKKGKAGKGGKTSDSKLTFSQEGGFAATGGAPGEKAECKQN